MTFDDVFFDKLGKELGKIIKELSKKQSLSDTEDLIKNKIENWCKEWDTQHFTNLKRLKELQNNSFTTDELKRKLKKFDETIVSPMYTMEYILIQNLCSIAMSFVLLYRQRYLNDFSRNPSNFMAEFFRCVIPELKPREQEIVEKNILRKLSNIEPETWAEIARPIKPRILILIWNQIDEDATHKNNTIKNTIKNRQADLWDVQPDPVGGTYEEYKSYIDRKLQSQLRMPDLILMDSILLAEYKAKGALYTAEYYIEGSLKKKLNAVPEMDIARTVNGNIEAIPITRNFHLPGYGQFFGYQGVKKIFNDGSLQFLELVDFGHELPITIRNSWRECTKHGFRPFSGIDIKNLPEGQGSASNNNRQFVTCMADKMPFIPMQAARGAHITYTFFAYLCGASTKCNSFISVEKRKTKEKEGILLKIFSQNILQKRIGYFFRLLYLYVPLVSLCLDHVRAGAIRSKNFADLWFDPCLPIEAQKFQKSKIVSGKNPIRLDSASLSCLGGYCLALTHNSDSKHYAVKEATELAEEYFQQGKVNGSDNFACRINYNYDKNNPDHDYISAPEKIARRPNFHGWFAVEEEISNVVRQYMLTVMILRAIVVESEKGKALTSDNLKKISSYPSDIKMQNDRLLDFKEYTNKVICETSIKNYLSEAKEIVKNLFEGYKVDQYYSKNIKSETNEWINLNFDGLIADRNAIVGLLQSELHKLESPNDIVENRIEYLAKRMSETLVDKLQTLCRCMEWEVELID